MKKFYKPLSVLLAITMCVSLVAPAFAEEPVQTEPTEIVQTESAQDELEVTVEDPTPETVKPPVDDDTIVDDDDTIVDNDPIVEDDGDDDTIVDDVNNAPTLSSNTLAEDQSPARAPRASHNWGDWVKVDDENHWHVCKGDILNWFCRAEETLPHNWDSGKIDGNDKVYTCFDCGATKTTDLDSYTVYVYVRVNGDVDDTAKTNGVLNDNGWFTVGKVEVNGLTNPSEAGPEVTRGEDDPDFQRVTGALSGLVRYGKNEGISLQGVSWDSLTTATGADDYSNETGLSRLTWHLNGYLPATRYTVTYTDGENGTIFADQTHSGLKWGSSTPVFNGTPTREGYDFTGWGSDWTYLVTGDVTYTAQWRVKSPETPDLEVEKEVQFVKAPDGTIRFDGKLLPGDTIQYQIIVTNNGNKKVTNVVIVDKLDDSKLEFVSASGGKGKSWPSEPANGRYEIGELDKAGTQTDSHYTLTITAKVKDDATGTIANTATAECTGMTGEKPSDTANVNVFEEKNITLSYSAGNGIAAENVPDPQTQTAGADGKATFTVSTTEPTREGYKFKGWAKGTSDVEAGETITLDKDATLTAKWEKEPEKYTVTWSFAKDTPESLVQYLPEESKHIAGDKVGVTSYGKFQIDGMEYSFNGWTSTPTVTVGEDGTFTMPAADVALVGSWTATELPKPVEQTIYQWLPGYGGTSDVPGTTDGAYKRVTINAGEKPPTDPENPTRDGYNFTGWSEGVDGENGDGVKTVTYTAQWAIKTYTVTFNANGGSAVGSQTVNHGQAATRPTAPSRSGYTFNGWRLADAASDYDFATPVTGDLTLTAQWSQNTTTGGGGGGGTTGGGGGGTGGGTGGGGGGGGTPTPTPTEPDEPVVEIPDEDVPLVEVPDVEVPQTETPEELVEVPEEDVPLADVPKTGDNTGLWRMAALMSAAGLAVLTALERRQRREE